MAKSLSITVHPSALGAEYLTVSDAMRQVLDVVEVLERSETAEATDRQIVWRLTEAHTNSPPFTVTVEAFPMSPGISIGFEATRVTALFADSFRTLLEGCRPTWIDSGAVSPLKRALQRNLNGVGRTEIVVDGGEPLNVVPSNARTAVVALERFELEMAATAVDYRRTEFGAVEVEVCGIARWNEKPALVTIDRLSREKVTCVLGAELAERLGPNHRWDEAWDGRRLLVTGALHFGTDGSLKRIDADDAENLPWTDVNLTDIEDIDILQGRTVSQHLDLIRGGSLG